MIQEQSIPKIEKTVATNTHALNNADSHPKNRDGLPQNEKQSKSEMMEELMEKPETYDEIGPAWRLFFRLISSGDGTLIGSWKDMAGLVGNVSGDSVKNWARHLKTKGIVEIEDKGKDKKIMLANEYMRVATAPQTVEKTVEKFPHGYNDLIALQKITQGASALGGRVKISLENCELKNGNGRQSA